MKKGRPWTPDDLARLYRHKRDSKPLGDIARLLDRSVWAVRAALLDRDRRIPGSCRSSVDGQNYRASQEALAERELRRAALDQQTLTQAFCGDPPPGFSALERR